jgi:hypothetical protein
MKKRKRRKKRLGVAGVHSAADAELAKQVEEQGIFSGEAMTCIMCGAQRQSDADVESSWRCVVIDGSERYYACPAEFPPDGAGREEFREAYLKVMQKILSIRAKTIREQLRKGD